MDFKVIEQLKETNITGKPIIDLKQDNKYHFLTGDVNYTEYGGIWYKYTSYEEVYLIELLNNEDIGLPSKEKYTIIEYYPLDINDILDPINKDKLSSALSVCGYNNDINQLTLSEIVTSFQAYGIDISQTFQTNNYRKGLNQVKR